MVERKKKGLFRDSDKKLRCQYCEVFFTRNRDCILHEKNFHKVRRVYSCRQCGEVFFSPNDLTSHADVHNPGSLSFKLYKQVFNGASSIFRKNITSENDQDPLEVLSLSDFQNEVANICVHQSSKRKRAYFNMCSHAIFLKLDESGDVMDKICFMAATKKVQITHSHSFSEIKTIVVEKVKETDERLQDFMAQGSGWTLSELVFVDLTFTTLGDMRGGCSFKYPSRRGLLNIESDDNLCLVYCVAAHLHHKSILSGFRKSAGSYRKYLKNFQLDGLDFPMSPDEVEKFEEVNPSFRINIFIEEAEEIFPYRINEYEKEKIFLNVLLVEGLTNSNQRIYHYILITDLDAFLQKKYNQGSLISYAKTIRCKKCYASFTSEGKKDDHETVCVNSNKQSLVFLKEWKKIYYNKPWNGFPHLLCGFVDFESVLVKTGGDIIIHKYYPIKTAFNT